MNVEAHPAWVAAIFARMQVAYGNRFGGMYGAADDAEVRADWRKRLAAMSPDRIRYALENLPPDHPPNAMQFVALCRSKPSEPPPSLPAPTPAGVVSPESRKRLQGAIQALGEAFGSRGKGRQWARRLKAAEESGQHLTEMQRSKWREAARGSAFTPSTQEPSIHAGCSDV